MEYNTNTIHTKPIKYYVVYEWSQSQFLGMNIELSQEMKSLLIATSSICPWSFVQGLVQRFGSHVAPPGTFHFLKQGILLSLVLSKPNCEDPLPLSLFVAIMDESEFPIKLLHYGLSLLGLYFFDWLLHFSSMLHLKNCQL